MAEATKVCFCGSCHSEVVGQRNPHRVRNTTAAGFAAANLALMSSDFSAFGATGPYVCPHCGGDVKASRKHGDPAPPPPGDPGSHPQSGPGAS